MMSIFISVRFKIDTEVFLQPQRGNLRRAQRVRRIAGLGFCECKDDMNSTLDDGKRRVCADCFRNSFSAYAAVVICQLAILLPCILESAPVFAADKGAVLLDGGCVSDKGVSEKSGDGWAQGIVLSVPAGGLNGGKAGGESTNKLDDCGAIGVEARKVKSGAGANEAADKRAKDGKAAGDDGNFVSGKLHVVLWLFVGWAIEAAIGAAIVVSLTVLMSRFLF